MAKNRTVEAWDGTLNELAGLLKGKRKVNDVLKSFKDMDNFEQQILSLNESSRKDLGKRDDEASGSSAEECEDQEEFDDRNEEEYSGMDSYDDLDPKKELELLEAPVEDDDDDEYEEDDDLLDEDLHDMDGESDQKKMKLDLSDDEESDQDGLENVKQVLSSYERKKLKLSKEIAQLEQENIGDKPWVLSGEVGAAQRPENSLLEQVVSFEHATKALPEITEDVTESFEQIIRNRIRERAFDDPVVWKPSEEGAKKVKRDLSDETQERDSLAKVYEGEMLASVGGEVRGLNSKTKAAHSEINKLFFKITKALDEMSGKKTSILPCLNVDISVDSD